MKSDHHGLGREEVEPTFGPPVPSEYYPPPWRLTGEGIILIYRFPRAWVERLECLTDQQRGNFAGGLGYVMMVNYHQSPVGPYKELLLIPGKFRPHGRQSITQIYVDSQASTDNGRCNWGIPKETIPMQWHTEGRHDRFSLGQSTGPRFNCQTVSLPGRLPMTTRLLPIRLHQELDGAVFKVNPTGSGWARLVRVTDMHADAPVFPDIQAHKPLVSFKVSPFHMHFPLADKQRLLAP